MSTRLITPAVMIGGSGTRLWPLSRSDRPKQFHRLTGPHTMLQTTVERFVSPGFAAPWLLGSAATLPLVAAQMDEIAIEPEGIILEPEMRGTAAAIAAVSLVIGQSDPDRLILIAPADHYIRDEHQFRVAVQSASAIAEGGDIVTFGIAPTSPETGFGYIAGGAPVVIDGTVFGERIEAGGFAEKPDLATAQRFVAEGYLWNAGIFLFRAGSMLEQLAQHAPETLDSVERACDFGREEKLGPVRVVFPDANAFHAAPQELSIDVGVMEKTRHAVVVPCHNIGWNDVGSLSALWEVAEKDAAGNATSGDVLLHNVRRSFVHSLSGRKTVVSGVEDMIVVDLDDAVVILPMAQAQSVKTIVKMLKEEDAPQLTYGRDAWFAGGEVHLLRDDVSHAVLSLRLQAGTELRERSVITGFETWVVSSGAMTVETDGRHLFLEAGDTMQFSHGDLMRVSATSDAMVAIVASSAPLSLAASFVPVAALQQTEAMASPDLSLAPTDAKHVLTPYSA